MTQCLIKKCVMLTLAWYGYVDNIQVGYPNDVKLGNEIPGTPVVGSTCETSSRKPLLRIG